MAGDTSPTQCCKTETPEATVRNVRVDGSKGRVCRIGMFEQALCEVVASVLPDCIMGTDIVPAWGTFPPPSLIKQKACNCLSGHAKWEPVRLAEPTQCGGRSWGASQGQILCVVALCGG